MSDSDEELRVGKGRVVGSWADSDWDSGDERPKKVRMEERLVRVEGRWERLVAWRVHCGGKLEAMLAALWRVVSVWNLRLRELALDEAVFELRRMV
jgi:hypothetical protein